MTFQQKNTTVTLASFSFILIFFVTRLANLWRTDSFSQPHVFRLWVIVVVLAVVATVIAMILTHGISVAVLAIRTGDPDPEIDEIVDERDQLIDLKGTRLTYTVSSLGSFVAMLTFVLGQSALLMFSLLMLFGIASQVVGDIWRLWLYREG